MDITPIIPGDRKIIDGYGPGLFRISGEVYRSAVWVFPDEVRDWSVTSVDQMDADSLSLAGEKQAEVLLLGMGPKMQLVPSAVKQALRAQGVGLEPMDTGAACRTYNILMAEGRRVAAALLPIG
ncbi:MAG: Mth938-like domain-containing protein [Pseudomonadota bacterium]